MNEYVRIRSGADSAKMANREFPAFVELVFAETCPEGFHPVVKDAGKPEPGEGQELAYTYQIQADGTARKSYFLVPAGTSFRPRTFSKLKCYAALSELGKWAEAKAWIEEAGLWDAFLLARDVAEDNPLFVSGLAALGGRLGLSDGQVEEILAKCVAEA